GELTWFTPVKKYRAGICHQVEQPASGRNGLGKRHSPGGRIGPCGEWELALGGRTTAAGGAKGKEGLRLLVEVDGIARPDPDIVPRLIDQRTERYRAPMAMAFEYHPRVLALILEAAGPRDHIEHPLACWLRRNAARGGSRRGIVHLADDGN